jgi:hypothetical protein
MSLRLYQIHVSFSSLDRNFLEFVEAFCRLDRVRVGTNSKIKCTFTDLNFADNTILLSDDANNARKQLDSVNTMARRLHPMILSPVLRVTLIKCKINFKLEGLHSIGTIKCSLDQMLLLGLLVVL